MTNRHDLSAWERAEILRSEFDAEQTERATLRIDQTQAQRYLHPRADTIYPLEYMFHLAGEVRGLRILDLGCGSGNNTVLLALQGAAVVGLDISRALVTLALERARVHDIERHATFLVGSAHALPFPDQSFDLVFGVAILHHLALDVVAGEVLRVLRPRGRAIFEEPVRNSPVVRALRALIPYRSPEVSPFERPLTDADLGSFSDAFTGGRRRSFCLPHVDLTRVLFGTTRHTRAIYRSDAALLGRFPRLASFASVRVFEVTRSASTS